MKFGARLLFWNSCFLIGFCNVRRYWVRKKKKKMNNDMNWKQNYGKNINDDVM